MSADFSSCTEFCCRCAEYCYLLPLQSHQIMYLSMSNQF